MLCFIIKLNRHFREDIRTRFLKKGKIYNVYILSDDTSRKFYAVHYDEMDEPGDNTISFDLEKGDENKIFNY